MRQSFLWRAALAVACAAGVAFGAWAQTPTPQVSKPPPAKQRTFPSPDAAADSLVEAIRKNDDKTISAVLGMGWRDIVPGTRNEEDNTRAQFLKAWDEAHKIVLQGNDKALVEVGKTGFTMPMPIVKDGNAWRFDVDAGIKEIKARFIGRNELAVVQTMLAIVDAQRDYAAMDPMRVGTPVYARRLVSTPGRMDGLYWESKAGEPQSPLGPLLAKAQMGGQANGYYGYHFRLLYRQGPAAKGGAHDYVVKDRMIGGFGAIAWPVRYGDTGVMTFIVNSAGDVYEQDLGPDTAQKAAAIASFNPDKGWEKADTTP
jgi:hypothetical protein